MAGARLPPAPAARATATPLRTTASGHPSPTARLNTSTAWIRARTCAALAAKRARRTRRLGAIRLLRWTPRARASSLTSEQATIARAERTSTPGLLLRAVAAQLASPRGRSAVHEEAGGFWLRAGRTHARSAPGPTPARSPLTLLRALRRVSARPASEGSSIFRSPRTISTDACGAPPADRRLGPELLPRLLRERARRASSLRVRPHLVGWERCRLRGDAGVGAFAPGRRAERLQVSSWEQPSRRGWPPAGWRPRLLDPLGPDRRSPLDYPLAARVDRQALRSGCRCGAAVRPPASSRSVRDTVEPRAARASPGGPTGTKCVKRLSSWPPRARRTSLANRQRLSLTRSSSRISKRSLPTPASTTRVGCPGTSSRSCALIWPAGLQSGLHAPLVRSVDTISGSSPLPAAAASA